MKRADVLLAAALLAACAAWLGARLLLRKPGAAVTVKVDGQIYGTYPLSGSYEAGIGDGNRIRIEDGAVWMDWADCPDQICVRQGRIAYEGATITCLPNRVTVQVTGAEADGSGPDVIAQ